MIKDTIKKRLAKIEQSISPAPKTKIIIEFVNPDMTIAGTYRFEGSELIPVNDLLYAEREK